MEASSTVQLQDMSEGRTNVSDLDRRGVSAAPSGQQFKTH